MSTAQVCATSNRHFTLNVKQRFQCQRMKQPGAQILRAVEICHSGAGGRRTPLRFVHKYVCVLLTKNQL